MSYFRPRAVILLVVLWPVAQGHFLHWSRSIQLESPDVKEAEEVGKHVKKAGENYTEQVKTSESEIERATKGAKYPFIAMLDHRLGKLLGKEAEHWYQDWKLWLGTFLWLAVFAKWIIRGYDEIYYQRGLFVFGLNILILHTLQYANSTKEGMFGVCVVISAQCLLQNYLLFCENLAKSEVGDVKDFLCDTLYLDLALPIEQIIVLFVSQTSVWWFYMTSILANFDLETVNYFFWLVAFLTMQMTMIFNRGDDSVLGNQFPVNDVHRLMANCDQFKFQLARDDSSGSQVGSEAQASARPDEGKESLTAPFSLTKTSILIRGVSGFFCNAILREIMSYTIPLMLMGFAEPMDFVVYCVGVNFICTLDDMHDKVYAYLPRTRRDEEGAN